MGLGLDLAGYRFVSRSWVGGIGVGVGDLSGPVQVSERRGRGELVVGVNAALHNFAATEVRNHLVPLKRTPDRRFEVRHFASAGHIGNLHHRVGRGEREVCAGKTVVNQEVVLRDRAYMKDLVIITVGERLILQFLLGHRLEEARLACGCLQAPDDAGLQRLSLVVSRRILFDGSGS